MFDKFDAEEITSKRVSATLHIFGSIDDLDGMFSLAMISRVLYGNGERSLRSSFKEKIKKKSFRYIW